MNVHQLLRRRAQRVRRLWMRSGGIQLVIIPRRPENPPPFVGPKEPASISGFLRRWMQIVRVAEPNQYASSIAQLAELGAEVGKLTHRQHRAFRRGKLKIITGAWPKAVQETQSSVNHDVVITQNFTYDIKFEDVAQHGLGVEAFAQQVLDSNPLDLSD